MQHFDLTPAQEKALRVNLAIDNSDTMCPEVPAVRKCLGAGRGGRVQVPCAP